MVPGFYRFDSRTEYDRSTTAANVVKPTAQLAAIVPIFGPSLISRDLTGRAKTEIGGYHSGRDID